MTNVAILAQLVAQAEGQGSDMVTLRAIIEEAVELGVRRASAAGTRSAKTRSAEALENIASVDEAWCGAHGGYRAAINDIIGVAQAALAVSTHPDKSGE